MLHLSTADQLKIFRSARASGSRASSVCFWSVTNLRLGLFSTQSGRLCSLNGRQSRLLGLGCLSARSDSVRNKRHSSDISLGLASRIVSYAHFLMSGYLVADCACLTRSISSENKTFFFASYLDAEPGSSFVQASASSSTYATDASTGQGLASAAVLTTAKPRRIKRRIVFSQ